MGSDKHSRIGNRKTSAHGVCARTYEDDIDPRRIKDANTGSRGAVDRKTLQFCAQVRRTLESVVESARAGARSVDIQVIAVSPAPSAARIAVILAPRHAVIGAIDAAACVQSLAPMFRNELARVLARKRLPQLVVTMLPAPPIEAENEHA